jgi:hypothetical protein
VERIVYGEVTGQISYRGECRLVRRIGRSIQASQRVFVV